MALCVAPSPEHRARPLALRPQPSIHTALVSQSLVWTAFFAFLYVCSRMVVVCQAKGASAKPQAQGCLYRPSRSSTHMPRDYVSPHNVPPKRTSKTYLHNLSLFNGFTYGNECQLPLSTCHTYVPASTFLLICLRVVLRRRGPTCALLGAFECFSVA